MREGLTLMIFDGLNAFARTQIGNKNASIHGAADHDMASKRMKADKEDNASVRVEDIFNLACINSRELDSAKNQETNKDEDNADIR